MTLEENNSPKFAPFKEEENLNAESSAHPQVCPGDTGRRCANCHMSLAQPGSFSGLCPARGLWALRCGSVLCLLHFLLYKVQALDRHMLGTLWWPLKLFLRRQWLITGNPLFSLWPSLSFLPHPSVREFSHSSPTDSSLPLTLVNSENWRWFWEWQWDTSS